MPGKTEEKKVGKANRTRSNHVCKLFFQGATALCCSACRATRTEAFRKRTHIPIRESCKDFVQVGFIGTGFYNKNEKLL